MLGEDYVRANVESAENVVDCRVIPSPDIQLSATAAEALSGAYTSRRPHASTGRATLQHCRDAADQRPSCSIIAGCQQPSCREHVALRPITSALSLTGRLA